MTEKDQEIFGMSSHNCRSNNSRFSLAASSAKPDDQLPTNCLVDNEDVPLLEEFDVLQNNEHCHSVFLSHSHIKAWKRLLWASILCLFFMLTEVIGGILAGSLAVMTDAAHLLSDFVGFLVSLFAIWVAAQPATKKFSFGYYRAEVLGALFSITVIWLLTGIFVYLAILRLIKSDYDIHADAMIVVSGFGIFVNLGIKKF
uniref:Cation efflux protein transmembrane domain-containing protein n=1 Tax=Clastoptera arizonana TaxID=38151 RepID=A0A1B6CSI2_9HEMI